MKSINPVQFLSKEAIEFQALADLATFSKKVNKPLSFPIYPDEIAEQLWDICVEYPQDIEKNEGIEVLACYIPSTKKILLNTSLDKNKGRTSFSLAHEVGHVSLHSFLSDFTAEGVKRFCRSLKSEADAVTIERQADKYATYLLMPKYEIDRVLQQVAILSGTKVFDFKLYGQKVCDHFCVSKQALCIRLSDLGIKVINGLENINITKPIQKFLGDEDRLNWSF